MCVGCNKKRQRQKNDGHVLPFFSLKRNQNSILPLVLEERLDSKQTKHTKKPQKNCNLITNPYPLQASKYLTMTGDILTILHFLSAMCVFSIIYGLTAYTC